MFFFACLLSPLFPISIPSLGINIDYQCLLIVWVFHCAKICRYRKNLRFDFAIARVFRHGFWGPQWSWVLPDMLHFQKFVSDPIILVIRAEGFPIGGLTFPVVQFYYLNIFWSEIVPAQFSIFFNITMIC